MTFLRLTVLILTALIWAAPVYADNGRILRVATTGLPPGLGNPYSANGPPSSTMWDAMFDGLTRIEADGSLAPALAVSWEVVEPTKWVFQLREGVTFSNGEPFDADAVVAVFDYLRSDEAGGSVIANELRGVEAVSAVDPYTVEFITQTPDAILPNRLVAVKMVAPKAWAMLGPTKFALEPSGTGAFALQTWGKASGKATTVAFTESWRWGGNGPNLDVIEFYELPEAAARLQALLSGQVDFSNLGPEDIPIVERRGLKIYSAPAPQVMSLAFFTEGRDDSPVADKRVRQALNYAVNKVGIADIIFQGFAKPAGQGVAPISYGYNPDIEPYPYDPDKAKALLAEAGYADGLNLSADMVVGSVPGDALIYQTVQQNLQAVGVKLTMRPTVFSDWFRQYLSGTFKGELFGLSWNASPYNDAMRPMEYFSCAKTNPFFCDDTVTPLLDAAAAELDGDKRLALLHELQAIYHELAPAIFLVEQSDIIGYAERYGNVVLVNRVIQYHRLTVAK